MERKTFRDVLVRNFNHESIMDMVGVVSNIETEGEVFNKGRNSFNELCKAIMVSYSGGASSVPMLATQAIIAYSLETLYNDWKKDVPECED